jgi:hypothetical protein
MKFYFRKYIYHWVLTGFVGKNSNWFLCYSSRPNTISPEQLADYLVQTGAQVTFNVKTEKANEQR